MNYETYARGEAHLGWLNAKGQVSSPVPFSPSTWMSNVFQMIERECQQRGVVGRVCIEPTLRGALAEALGNSSVWT